MRTHSLTRHVILAFLATLACISQLANATNSPAEKALSGSEQKFREQMGLADYRSVEYQDTKGNPITFAQFEKLMSKSAGFNMEKRKSDSQISAVLKLQASATPLPAARYKIAPGAAFPDFKMRATDGSTIDNQALHGHYTLLSFYFAECAPCIKEVPMLNEFAARNKDLVTFAITFDSAKEASAFAAKTKFGWRTVADARALIDKVGVNAYPTLALLDPQGKLVAIDNNLSFGKGSDGLNEWVRKSIAAHGRKEKVATQAGRSATN